MNIAALQRQIEVLEIVKAANKRFDIAVTIHHDIEGKCGTTACAFGWFVLIGQWPGLSVDESEGSNDPWSYMLNGQSFRFTTVIIHVFDLDKETAKWLFWPELPPKKNNPDTIINRIKLLIELNDEYEFVSRMDMGM